ncbi:YdbL family protein [Phenylobacterium soli]|uniref:DUF1318 domain-containing protein n=1 Tax=Phenylobacterium soli TaxID=2170551 RepID=A0A328ALW7_9CAUL|nr:YdbL family protein [Phenylobacterium soli]RAK53858.1 DUF1318 domain-containing protein [Phenylobacterium soli]
MNARNIFGLALAGAVFATGAVAIAQSDAKARVDSAKAAGIVGEQGDGFLGFVSGAADPALKAAVDEINAGRAQLYREAAAKNGVSPEAAGASAFNTVVKAKLKPGEYYKPNGGAWTRK